MLVFLISNIFYKGLAPDLALDRKVFTTLSYGNGPGYQGEDTGSGFLSRENVTEEMAGNDYLIVVIQILRYFICLLLHEASHARRYTWSKINQYLSNNNKRELI